MRGFRRVLVFGAGLALLLPSPVVSARSSNGAAGSDSSRYIAQYDGPSFGPEAQGPYGGGGPPSADPGRDRRYARSRDAGGSVSYHGFRIKLAYPAGTAEADTELAGAQRQIDIVESTGLSGSALRLFRSQPIDFGQRSHFTRESVILGDMQGHDERPVLLHEFMHIYHRSRLPGGFDNPTIKRFYEEARASRLYPEGSYMLRDVREYFAMTASCFLNGTVARPPYNRDAIRAAQPAYYAYLVQLFGNRG